ncbi:DUF202 domain-containing protein [Phytohabitans rumicis]|uniref:DUF202 domain-containing protein n=1 Tax=Phytohabitans rumicis TaxID=1076125 RepID=A0A6V8KZG8_9ACTN|nr:DUF202 domain-containing protein [Phytohabitans rumicis]GFJ89224.1 hypothetical protein Prum_028660 [Phytohabitans rumicis]
MTERESAVARTRMAWRRTFLAFAAIAVLAARLAAENGDVLLVAVALAGWPALVGLTYRETRRALPLYALFTAGYAGLGAVLVLTR